MKTLTGQQKSRMLDAIKRGVIIAPKGSKAAAMTTDDMAAFIVNSGMGDSILDQTAQGMTVAVTGERPRSFDDLRAASLDNPGFRLALLLHEHLSALGPASRIIPTGVHCSAVARDSRFFRDHPDRFVRIRPAEKAEILDCHGPKAYKTQHQGMAAFGTIIVRLGDSARSRFLFGKRLAFGESARLEEDDTAKAMAIIRGVIGITDFAL